MITKSPNGKSQNSNAGRPSMCRTCGSIIGAGQQQCAVCGTSISQSVQAAQRAGGESEPMRFARSVLSRPYKFTIVLLVVNIFVFVMMWQTSGLPLSMTNPVPPLVLLAFGAKLNYLIQTQHQWWRFVTPMFIHVNLLHLIVNMYSLWMVGPYVEKLYGSAKFVVFWVLTGIAGVVASYLTVRPGMNIGPLTGFIFKAYDTPSAGASGALFGLIGVLFVFGIKFRHELPEGFKRAFGTGLLPMIIINLFIGYVLRGFIDNSAHLGGLASGVVLALMVNYSRPGERGGVALTWRVLQGLAIALVALCFVMGIRNLNRPLPPELAQLAEQSQSEPTTEVQNPEYLQFAIAINNAQEALVVAMKDGNPGNIDNAVKGLESAPHLDQKSDELREQLKTILTQAKSIAGVAVPSPGPPQNSPRDKLGIEFVAWRKEYNQWLKTNAKKYNGLGDVETK